MNLWGFVLQGIMGKKITHEEFLIRWKEKVKNPEYKILGKYKNRRTHILVVDKYGKCLIQTHTLLVGSNPTIKSAINKTKYCVNQFKEVHGDTYDYSLVDYSGSNIKVTIICPEHGQFKVTPNVHLAGHKCSICAHKTKGVTANLNQNEFETRVIPQIKFRGMTECFTKINEINGGNKIRP